jgi:hypothetical protein
VCAVSNALKFAPARDDHAKKDPDPEYAPLSKKLGGGCLPTLRYRGPLRLGNPDGRGSGGFDVSHRGDFARRPRTVFLSLRSFFHSIPYFYKEILPRIESPFVLVTGSEDITIPNQTDARWRAFSPREKEIIDEILDDPQLIHWFAENGDESRPKMSTLPVGYVFHDGATDVIELPHIETRITKRRLRVFCSHRVRNGPQWEARRRVTALCRDHFQSFCSVLTAELSPAHFQRAVQSHSFVLCVQGGGLDPSPKAWFCIANGAIPIIKSSTLDDAYRELPVAFVQEWSPDCLSPSQLQEWREQLAPFYEEDALRAQVAYKLSIDFWWSRIIAYL